MTELNYMVDTRLYSHEFVEVEYALLVNALKYHYELMDTTKL